LQWKPFVVVGILVLFAGIGLWAATRERRLEQPPENLPIQPSGAANELPTLRVGDRWSFEGTILYQENVVENIEVINIENIADRSYYLLASSIEPLINYKGTDINGRRLWIERDTLQLARWQGLWDNTAVEITVENENHPVDWVFSYEFSGPLWPLGENQEPNVTVTENTGGTVLEPVIYSVRVEVENMENFELAYYLDNELYGALRYSPDVKFYTRISMPIWIGGNGSLELKSYSIA
jgi:hypothetical protein